MDIHSEIEITIDADELVEEARETIESIIDEHLGNSYTESMPSPPVSGDEASDMIAEAQAAFLQSAAFRHAVREAVKTMVASGFLVLKGNVSMYSSPSDLA
jgi:hypothetical protein